MKQHHLKAFTLIEVVMYLWLFSLVIGAGVSAVWQIIQSADVTYQHVVLQEEANFLFAKMETTETNLFSLDNSNLQIIRAGQQPLILNSSSISVSNFLLTPEVDTSAVDISFTLTTNLAARQVSQDFSFTKYEY